MLPDFLRPFTYSPSNKQVRHEASCAVYLNTRPVLWSSCELIYFQLQREGDWGWKREISRSERRARDWGSPVYEIALSSGSLCRWRGNREGLESIAGASGGFLNRDRKRSACARSCSHLAADTRSNNWCCQCREPGDSWAENTLLPSV